LNVNGQSGPRRLRQRAAVLLFSAVALATSGFLAASPSVAQSVHPDAKVSAVPMKQAAEPAPNTKRLCSTPDQPGTMACLALARTDIKGHMSLSPNLDPSGYGPTDLQSAYALPSSSSGSGQTVAIVDAFDDPNAERDLGTYRSQYGLPACTTANGCFKKVSQTGSTTSLPSPDAGWAGEISLDLDMVSAVCPNCHILLVEADQPSTDDLGTAVNRAVTMGAKFVSNSYGGSEDPSDTSADSAYFNHPGVAITVSSGDEGYGAEYPASSRFVTAVGGTSLRTSSSTRGWSETVWGSSFGGDGAGSGCSAFDAKPSWQTDTGCSKRTVADVSAVADPATGLAVYDSYQETGWQVYGGTSASSPIIAGVYALAGAPASGSSPASFPYSHTGNLNDVTSGANGSCGSSYLCTAKAGYDGPTGLGTPNGTTAFGGSGGGGGGGSVSVTNPGSQSTTLNASVSLQIHATDSTSGQTLHYSASGLPTGLSINASSGLISGTASSAGTFQPTVTATDGNNVSGSTSFTWSVTGGGGGGTCSGQILGNPGFESGTAAPWTASSGVLNNSGDAPTHSGSWLAWLDGYGTTHTDTVSQSVSIPSGCSATLSFWVLISSEDDPSAAFDTLTVKAGSTTLATYSNRNANDTYVQKTINLSSFAGRTVNLTFTGSEDVSFATSFLLDDTALNLS
jgi:subtilase family serine protease